MRKRHTKKTETEQIIEALNKSIHPSKWSLGRQRGFFEGRKEKYDIGFHLVKRSLEAMKLGKNEMDYTKGLKQGYFVRDFETGPIEVVPTQGGVFDPIDRFFEAPKKHKAYLNSREISRAFGEDANPDIFQKYEKNPKEIIGYMKTPGGGPRRKVLLSRFIDMDVEKMVDDMKEKNPLIEVEHSITQYPQVGSSSPIIEEVP